MGEKKLEPFGPLQGVKILDSGRNNAGPWAASLAADFGADVIHVEPPMGEIYRMSHAGWAQEKRNQRSLTLNMKAEGAQEIFLKLLEKADIWIESSIPGTYEKLGLTDERILERNPKLVIMHVSGYGQTGPLHVVTESWGPPHEPFRFWSLRRYATPRPTASRT